MDGFYSKRLDSLLCIRGAILVVVCMLPADVILPFPCSRSLITFMGVCAWLLLTCRHDTTRCKDLNTMNRSSWEASHLIEWSSGELHDLSTDGFADQRNRKAKDLPSMRCMDLRRRNQHELQTWKCHHHVKAIQTHANMHYI